VPEWQTGTSYFIGSIVRKADTNELYSSITDDNVGQALPASGDNANWIQVYPVRTTTLVGSITNAQITSLAASKITGTLVDAQITSISANKITGQIVNAQIQDVAATKITGTIVDAQIGSLAATKLTGTIDAARYGNNTIPDAAIVAVSASKISGTTLALNILNALTSLKFASFEMLKILQIQMATTNTEASISSTSFSNTNLTLAFTPKISSSKVLVFGSGSLLMQASDTGYSTIARDGINLAPNNNGFGHYQQNNNYFINMMTIDTPGTVSAVTYAVRLRTNGGASFIRFPVNLGAGPAAAVLIAIELAQ
jgi:hypothetical protein